MTNLGQRLIKSTKEAREPIQVVYSDGYWWVEIPDELWYNASSMDYLEGIPIYVRR